MREAPFAFVNKQSKLAITMSDEAQNTRSLIRKKRAALSDDAVANAAFNLNKNLWKLPELSRAKSIAAYLGVNGEADCGDFIQNAWQRKKRIFVPVLRKNTMLLAPLFSNSELENNRFGIPEPKTNCEKLKPAHKMNVILLPLVAFDNLGNRIGMGGGYYDRFLRFMKYRDSFQRPLLIGMAYDFQRVDGISANDWDIPLHIVVTDSRIYRF